MEIKNCSSCGNEIPDFCPHCGKPPKICPFCGAKITEVCHICGNDLMEKNRVKRAKTTWDDVRGKAKDYIRNIKEKKQKDQF